MGVISSVWSVQRSSVARWTGTVALVAILLAAAAASARGAILASGAKARKPAAHRKHLPAPNPCLSLRTVSDRVCASDLPNRILGKLQSNGTLSRASELEAFAAAIAPLPGVHVPKGRAGLIEDATPIIAQMVHLLPSLSRRQRAAAQRAIYAVAGGRPAVLRALRHHAARASAANSETDTDLGILHKLVLIYNKALDVHFGLRLTVNRNPFGAGIDKAGFAEAFTADGKLSGGRLALCVITITGLGTTYHGQDLDHLLAHELFHCFQFQLGGIPAVYSYPRWLIEGGAEWAACSAAPTDGWSNNIGDYVSAPGKSLSDRSYDAEGFFDHLADVGINPYQRMKAMLSGVIRPGQLYDEALGTSGSEEQATILGSWASGLFQQRDRGEGWTANLPCHGSVDTQVKPRQETVSAGKQVTLKVGPAATGQYALDVTAGQITVKVDSGYVRISGSAQSTGGDRVNDVLGGKNTEKTYCTTKGGVCCPPAGSPTPTGQLDPGPTQPELGLSGSVDGGTVTLTGVSNPGAANPTACTTVQFAGKGSLSYDTTTHDADPNSDCQGSSTTTTHYGAGQLGWDDTWVNQVFGGPARTSSLGGAESNTTSYAYDYSGCNPGTDTHADDPCPGNATTCTIPGSPCSEAISGSLIPSQLPSLSYQSAAGHTVGIVSIGLDNYRLCVPAFQISALSGAPLFAVFDLYPSKTEQTTTLSYALNGSSACAAVQSSPPPSDTQSCTVSPALNATVTITGPVTARQAPASEHLRYDLLAAS